ncbi:MAG: hypothetical protein O7J95_16530, partial [Planctomycetota bacterium]|nr:hypothetical protein [Planctomycetota bacterium]
VMRGIQPVGSCPATHDTFVDGKVDLLDAWLLIHFLFSVTPRGLTPPFRECGRYARLPIPTVLGDPLECTDFAACP